MFFKSSSSIELFGVSGCGKSFIRDKIIQLLKKSNNKILDSRELVILYSNKVIDLNLVDKQILNYFKIVKKIKTKKKIQKNYSKKYNYNNKYNNHYNLLQNITSKIKNKYESICVQILSKNKKSKNIYKFILNILKKSNHRERKIYHFWFVELLAAYCIKEKIKKKYKFIYFPDEGFLQRSFLFDNLFNKKDINKIKKYLKIVPKSEIIFNIKSKEKIINKVHSFRKKIRAGRIKNKIEIKKMIKFERELVNKYACFKFKIIENNSKLAKTLNNHLLFKTSS